MVELQNQIFNNSYVVTYIRLSVICQNLFLLCQTQRRKRCLDNARHDDILIRDVSVA
jgi:hypothetical protein